MVNIVTNKKDVTEVIAHDVSPLVVNTDARSYALVGWLIIIVGVLGFIVWATFAPLDKGVPMQGVVAKESNRQAVQHQLGGTIKEILVKDGDVVKAGQVLVRMNDVSAKSQAEISRTQYYSAKAMEARLLAERDGLKAVAFPVGLEKYKNDPRLKEAMHSQEQLFNARQLALKNELGSMDENIAGLRQQQKGLEESRQSKKQQLDILKDQLDNLRDLSRDGYIARSRMLDQERTYAQVNGAISEDIGNIGHIQSQILEMSLRRIQRAEEYQKEVRTQLSDTQKEAGSLESRLLAQDYEVNNVEVRAPTDGVVVGLNVFTDGGVVPPGFRMMDLVPSDDQMVVEGQLPVNLIDKVHDGLPVELIFSAFNANRTPHIPGVVMQVAADRTVDEKSGTPYYKVRARVTAEGAKMIAAKKLNIQSGMPVELFVKTGERTMMSYLLKPVFDRAKSSMSED